MCTIGWPKRISQTIFMAFAVACSLVKASSKRKCAICPIQTAFSSKRFLLLHSGPPLGRLQVLSCGTRDTKQAELADAIRRLAKSDNSDDRAKVLSR